MTGLCVMLRSHYGWSFFKYLFIISDYLTYRPKLFGYGAMPLIYITPCVVFTLFSIHRLQLTMRAHQMLWKDMANQVRFERPDIPPPPTRSRTYAGLGAGQSSPGSDNVSFQSSYNLVALRSPRLDVPDSPSSLTHPQNTWNSTISSPYDIHDNSAGENAISVVHLSDRFARHPPVDIVPESPVDNSISPAECDVSSYGGPPGKQNHPTSDYILIKHYAISACIP